MTPPLGRIHRVRLLWLPWTAASAPPDPHASEAQRCDRLDLGDARARLAPQLRRLAELLDERDDYTERELMAELEVTRKVLRRLWHELQAALEPWKGDWGTA